jgi:hypothetical protein
LLSEQRAFTAMWIEKVREHLSRGAFDLDGFIEEIKRESTEFEGFYGIGSRELPGLKEQTREHFTKIAAYLARLSCP